MPTRRLPSDPSLEQLRNQAKALHRSWRAGEEQTLALARELHPDPPPAVAAKRADAQLVVARLYGFASWPRLVGHVETVTRYTRNPHLEPVGAPVADEHGLVDEFLRLACLTYGADDPSRLDRAHELLAAHPELASATIHAAAAVGDAAAATAMLAGDASLATAPGGSYRWEPLLYACYSRVAVGTGRSAVTVAQLLLRHGADPNAAYLWAGECLFTAVTGAFGGGEGGNNQPPHPESGALARLLLEAGADPNDAQTLYNRHFRENDDHLEVLLEYGLGRGDGGPWARRLGPDWPTPRALVEEQLAFAAAKGYAGRVELLLAHGVDPDPPGPYHPTLRGRRAVQLAAENGSTRVVELLVAAGAAPPELDAVDELIAACLAGDASRVEELVADRPTLLAEALARHPTAIARAAGAGRIEAVRLLVGLGFDVNAYHRTTALHEAAWAGDRELAEALLSLGADPRLTDREHHATPAGWARYNGHAELAELLAARESG